MTEDPAMVAQAPQDVVPETPATEDSGDAAGQQEEKARLDSATLKLQLAEMSIRELADLGFWGPVALVMASVNELPKYSSRLVSPVADMVAYMRHARGDGEMPMGELLKLARKTYQITALMSQVLGHYSKIYGEHAKEALALASQLEGAGTPQEEPGVETCSEENNGPGVG